MSEVKSKEKKYCIYKHTSPSGKAYIGITNNYKRRCYAHKAVKSNKCIRFSRAIEKHGWDSFKHEVLIDGLTLEQANRYEVFYISEHSTLSPNGYNLNTGGLVMKPSEESILTMSNAQKNHPVSTETRRKLKEAAKNRSYVGLTDEYNKLRWVNEGLLYGDELFYECYNSYKPVLDVSKGNIEYLGAYSFEINVGLIKVEISSTLKLAKFFKITSEDVSHIVRDKKFRLIDIVVIKNDSRYTKCEKPKKIRDEKQVVVYDTESEYRFDSRKDAYMFLGVGNKFLSSVIQGVKHTCKGYYVVELK
jgi:group I intron endonuclease